MREQSLWLCLKMYRQELVMYCYEAKIFAQFIMFQVAKDPIFLCAFDCTTHSTDNDGSLYNFNNNYEPSGSSYKASCFIEVASFR